MQDSASQMMLVFANSSKPAIATKILYNAASEKHKHCIHKEKETVSVISRFVLPIRTSIMLALAVVLFATLQAPAAKAQGTKETFNIGKITLMALLDHSGAHDVKLFSGASTEVIKTLVPTGQAASSINAFLAKTDGKNVLIDTGMGAKSDGKLVQRLALLGLSPADIDIILITHMHFDHIGGLAVDGQAVYPKAVLKISDLEQEFWLAPNASNPKNNPYINFDAAKAAVAPYIRKTRRCLLQQAQSVLGC